LRLGPYGPDLNLPTSYGCRGRLSRACRQRIVARYSLTTETIEMATGTVKWFNSTKGFGFIQPSDGGKDVFVHISAVERSGLNGLNEGQKINYEVATERGRSAAVNLKSAD
jgi:CspA family cold shock protein